MYIDWEPHIYWDQEEMPADIETETSTYSVILRKDQVPYEQCNEAGEVERRGWKCLEAMVSNIDFVADYVKQLVEQNKELKAQNEELKTQNEELKQKVEEDDLTIMLGMADSFEILTELQGV